MKTLLIATLLLVSAPAVADRPIRPHPYVFIGIDRDISERRVFCNYRSEAATYGIGQTLYNNGRVEIDVKYTHHSCTTEYRDRNVYDGVGVHAKIYLWSK